MKEILSGLEVNSIGNSEQFINFKSEVAEKIYNDKTTSISNVVLNLSHSWRQPLNSLNFCILNLIDEVKSECKDSIDLDDYYKEMWTIIKNLSEKIDKFQSFFELSGENNYFEVKKIMDLTFEIMEEKIKKENIKIDMNIDENIKMYSSPNEFSQLIYNIFHDIMECCQRSFDFNNRHLSVTIDSNNNMIKFNIKLKYNIKKYENVNLNLNNLIIMKNIVEQKMKGGLYLIDTDSQKGIILNFPLDIKEA